MKTLSHLLLILLLPTCVLAQDYKRTWNWYFGDSLGLNFSTNPPTVISGSIGKTEGTSAISDSNGNLLFYTNGVTVWNKNHQVMQNGTGLNGHISSTQAALIVPQPDNDSLFYVFTTDALGQSKGLQYSIVNMNANGGLGAVIVKNILLQTPVCEKLCATKHQNGKDIWVLAHGFGNNTFYCYLVTKDGLIDCPIISKIGSIHDNSSATNAPGAMKFSTNGKKLAVTVYLYPNSKIDMFDFNDANGDISNHTAITNILLPYGIEFSKNGRHLFVTTRPNELITYDVSLNSSLDIENSKVVLADYNNAPSITGLLQIGTDNKIYISFVDSLHISLINTPDSGGTNSGFEYKKVYLNGRKTSLGLPNFVSSYFHRLNIDFTYQISCSSLAATLTGKFETNPSNISWQIKRISNGVTTSYTTQNVSHIFPDSGNYEVQLIADNDTATKTIFIEAPILPESNTLGCGTDSVVLNVPTSYRCLQWGDTSATLYSRTIRTNGIYVLQGYNTQGCLVSDSVRINFTPTPAQPVITKNNDSLISSAAFSYQWYRNDTLIAGANLRGIKPVVAGLYKVLITDSNGCSNVSIPYSSNVGTGELSSDAIKIYPNPATTSLTIELANTVYDLSITDVTGRIVFTQTSITNSPLQINCKSLLKGIYFIQINSLNSTYRKKLIIQ